ncbi:hypothetical protein EVAR_103557_1 [Eumeta japonica]|uniref:Uncharacterized protein n=1 Tax=Eumeta variegata TaxID=151549 RepID=A0A4C1YHG0_EUMVA|nr:hypothetical protein EVAR_103557_1 [Eumeta japonica]
MIYCAGITLPDPSLFSVAFLLYAIAYAFVTNFTAAKFRAPYCCVRPLSLFYLDASAEWKRETDASQAERLAFACGLCPRGLRMNPTWTYDAPFPPFVSVRNVIGRDRYLVQLDLKRRKYGPGRLQSYESSVCNVSESFSVEISLENSRIVAVKLRIARSRRTRDAFWAPSFFKYKQA